MNADASTVKKPAGKDKSAQKIDKEGYLYMAPEDGKALKKYYVVYIIAYIFIHLLTTFLLIFL